MMNMMNKKAKILTYIPSPIKSFLKRIYWSIIDTLDAIKGRDELTPPRSMNFAGDGDYREKGLEFKQYFIDLGKLKSDEYVLDVGCGIGRMAVPLTSYLSKSGEYHGFDIVQEGIDWCQKQISTRFPNFHFQHVDVKNKEYNPDGKYLSNNFQFPYKDDYFDFIFLTSVFTHMLPKDLENYFSEISRVLKPKGRCLITFFLLNDDSKNLIHNGKSSQNFIYDIGDCLTTNKEVPEAAVAYEEAKVKELFKKNKLMISKPIYYGSWCGRFNYTSYQDILIASKEL